MNQNSFCKTLEKIGYLSIRTQGSQWTHSIRDWGNLAASIKTTEEHNALENSGWWLVMPITTQA